MNRSIIVLFSLVAIGCGADGEAGGETYAFDDAEGACAAFVDAVCRHQVACGAAGSTAECQAALDTATVKAECERKAERLVTAEDAGAIDIDWPVLSACMEALASRCEPLDTACFDSGVAGQRAIGDACGLDDECTSGARCDRTKGVCPGICVARGQIGQTCEHAFDGSTCAAGLACHDGTCVARIAYGQPCPGEAPCAEDLICHDGACRTRAEATATCSNPVGGPCTVDGYECSGAGPDAALTCHVRFAVYVGEGDACDIDASKDATPRRRCRMGLTCNEATGTCEALHAAGEPCSGPDQCALGLECSGAVCAALPAAGDACTGQCAGLLECIDGTCSARRATGQPCTSNGHCESGECAPDGTCAADCVAP